MSNNNPGCLGFIFQMFGLMPKNKTSDSIETEEAIKFPYSLRDDFMSNAEFSFYKVMTQVINNKAIICPKVSLNDIFFVTEKDRSQHQIHLNKINRKHVDFLLCTKETLKPICAIELDDSSHLRQDRIERDAFVDKVFEASGLPLVRFKNKSSYSINEIEEHLLPMLEPNKNINNDLLENHHNNSEESTYIKEYDPIPNCPKCGTEMVLREAKRGENKGNKFYGCSNFPKCNGVIEIK